MSSQGRHGMIHTIFASMIWMNCCNILLVSMHNNYIKLGPCTVVTDNSVVVISELS